MNFLTQVTPLLKVTVSNPAKAMASGQLTMTKRDDPRFQVPKFVLEGPTPQGWTVTFVDVKMKLTVRYEESAKFDAGAAGPPLHKRLPRLQLSFCMVRSSSNRLACVPGAWRFYYLMDPALNNEVQKALGRNTVPAQNFMPEDAVYFTSFSSPSLLAWLLKEGQYSESMDAIHSWLSSCDSSEACPCNSVPSCAVVSNFCNAAKVSLFRNLPEAFARQHG